MSTLTSIKHKDWLRMITKREQTFFLSRNYLKDIIFCQAQREDFFLRAKPYKEHPTIISSGCGYVAVAETELGFSPVPPILHFF
ncbi:hypothetical protein MKW98_021470, partial [Papaver atlanticum]